jgi:hypothetical protein
MLAKHVEALPGGDGEIVIVAENALDFEANQLRLYSAASRVEKLSRERIRTSRPAGVRTRGRLSIVLGARCFSQARGERT